MADAGCKIRPFFGFGFRPATVPCAEDGAATDKAEPHAGVPAGDMALVKVGRFG